MWVLRERVGGYCIGNSESVKRAEIVKIFLYFDKLSFFSGVLAVKKFFFILSRGNLLVICSVAYVLSQFLVIWLSGPTGKDIISLQLTISPEKFQGIIASWSDSGVKSYLEHLYYDYFHAVIYTLFLASFSAFSFRKKRGYIPENFIRLFLFIAVPGLLDWMENSLHLWLLSGFLSDWNFWVKVSFFASLGKWISVGFVLFMSVWALLDSYFEGD